MSANRSTSTPFVFRSQPAQMIVMRNDGYCWGRVTLDDSPAQYDINTSKDHYEDSDAEATQAFINASRREANVDDAQGWL